MYASLHQFRLFGTLSYDGTMSLLLIFDDEDDDDDEDKDEEVEVAGDGDEVTFAFNVDDG